jgi:RIO-like serine/threonine protein kinase
MQYLNNLAEFNALVGNETKLIVIDFTATWYVTSDRPGATSYE